MRRAAAAAVRVVQPGVDEPVAVREATVALARRRRSGRGKNGGCAGRGRDRLGGAGRGDPGGVRFLDDVIEQNKYPIDEIDEMTKQTRKIGLGLMGWADLLFLLGIRYDSDEAIELAVRVVSFMRERADAASEALAAERGVFPAWEGSIYDPASGDPRGGRRYRNSTRTTIAPTGTLSIIADCSGGIEPAFALAFMRQHFLDRKDPSKVTRLPEVNRTFAAIARGARFLQRRADDVPRRGRRARGARRCAGVGEGRLPDVARHRAGVARADAGGVPAAHGQRREQDDQLPERGDGRGRRARRTCWRTARGARASRCTATARATSRCCRTRRRRGRSRRRRRRPRWRWGCRRRSLPAGAHPAPAVGLGPRPAGAPYRRQMPDERRSVTHKFRVGEQEGYVTVGLYDDGIAGRDLREHLEGGFDDPGADGQRRGADVDGAAVRRAAAEPRREVPGRALRAGGVHSEPGQSRRRRRWWTTSSGGWSCGSSALARRQRQGQRKSATKTKQGEERATKKASRCGRDACGRRC